ncbi:MAG: NADH-quinone oxidoreductase subunit H [Mycobacteriaceae bacterium]
MGEWWLIVLGPALLGVLALSAASWSAVLDGRAAGTSVRVSQPLREVGGLLIQQRRVTPAADTVLWRVGGAGVGVAAVLAVLVVPLGHRPISDLSIGVVWFNGAEVLAWAALWLAGWGANSVFGLVGGYRFVAQGLAYELPHMFALITAALGAQSLRVGDIVAAQSHVWFVVWMPVAFVVYLISALAMSFSGPFDQPVGTDLAGGVAAELSGVDRLVFAGGRYLLLTAAAAMAVPLFLGGDGGPLLPGWVWVLVKTVVVLGGLVWLRTRMPTVRMDRFTEVAWVVLIPLTLVQALVVAVVVLLT